MACCQKRRKQQVKKLMQRRLFESETLRVLARLKDKSSTTLKTNLLLDYHLKTHMLYKGVLKHKPPNKKFANQIVSIHDEYVREMSKRRMKHTTPLKKI
jgi:hypothetical protein